MQNKKVFVTGGTGLVGSHLIVDLLNQGCQVHALKRKSSDTTIIAKVANWLIPNQKLDWNLLIWIESDLNDYALLVETMQEVDEVYHCAAIISFDPRKREQMIHKNIQITASLVDAALESKVGKFCHVSSVASFGRAHDHNGLIDEASPRNPNEDYSGYSISKYYSEMEVWRGITEGLHGVIVNPSLILGPGNWNQSSQKMFRLVSKGMKFFTSGVTGFVDVRDVTKVMQQLMEKEVFGERYCLHAENLSYKEVFSKIALALNKKPPSIEAGPRMMNFAWRMMRALSYLSGKEASITKETARSSQSISNYSSTKITDQLDFSFRKIDETIAYTTNAFLADGRSLKRK